MHATENHAAIIFYTGGNRLVVLTTVASAYCPHPQQQQRARSKLAAAQYKNKTYWIVVHMGSKGIERE